MNYCGAPETIGGRLHALVGRGFWERWCAHLSTPLHHQLCCSVLKFLILLCRSYVLGDDCLPRREHLWSGAGGLQAFTHRTWITLEGGKRQ